EVDRKEVVAYADAAVIATAGETAAPRGGGAATAVASATQTVTLPLYERIVERYLEVRLAQTHEVITTIEVLSPTNKDPGEGRNEYEAKRRHMLQTLTNLVEIDLQR